MDTNVAESVEGGIFSVSGGAFRGRDQTERRPLPREEDTELLADAFEISQVDVLLDAIWVRSWEGGDEDLQKMLTVQHAWQPSLAPFYVRALRDALDHGG